MRSTMGKVLCVVIAILAISTVGCNSKYKHEISRLENELNELSSQNFQLKGELSRIAYRESDLKTRLQTARSSLALAEGRARTLSDQLSETRRRPAEVVPVRVGVGETQLYSKTLGSDVLFASGRATLTTQGKTALSKVATRLKTSYPGKIIRIFGHTDSDRIVKSKKLWRDNLDLSANRAMAVSRYLASRGIKAERIETIAMGKTRPVASNKTKAGKTKNRRVEIVVVSR